MKSGATTAIPSRPGTATAARTLLIRSQIGASSLDACSCVRAGKNTCWSGVTSLRTGTSMTL